MQFITGRVVFIGNNRIIQKENYHFSSVIFVIKKKMSGKIRNICFECVGKVADFVLSLQKDDKVEIKYFIKSALRNDKWLTNLQAKEVFKIEQVKKNEEDSQLNIEL